MSTSATLAEALAAKHAIVRARARIDYGLYAFLGEETIEKVLELVAGGAIGFKLYMDETFGKLPTPSTGAMLEAFEVVAPTGKRDPAAPIAARPAVVAAEAVSRAAVLAEWTGARVHILTSLAHAEHG